MRINITRLMHGDALHVASVFIGGPDIAKVTEGDLSIVIAGMPQQPHF